MTLLRPTIIFVPGAWHLPSCFRPTMDVLQAVGYETLAVSLPSVNAMPPLQDWSADIEAIRETLLRTLEQSRDVVMVFHSYGGLPGSEACKGLTREEREANGKKNGVVRLVYMSSFFAEEGGYLMELLGNKPLPWFDIQGDYVYAINCSEIFYNDIGPETVKTLTADLGVQSYPCFWNKVTYAAWKHIPSTYILCNKDNAIPVKAQEGMLASTDVSFDIERCDASHTPFVSQPEFIAECVMRAAGEQVQINKFKI